MLGGFLRIKGQVENGGNGGPVGKPTGYWSPFSTRDDGQIENDDRWQKLKNL